MRAIDFHHYNGSWDTSTVFRGARKAASTSDSIDRKINSFTEGLQSLIEWDKATHPHPVFKQIRMSQLVKNIRRFLNRQAKQKESQFISFNIGIAGGAAAGKTTLKNHWTQELYKCLPQANNDDNKSQNNWVSDLEIDNFYKNFKELRTLLGDVAFFQQINVDAPNVLTLDKVYTTLKRLSLGKPTQTPLFNMKDSSRQENAVLKTPAPFLIIEGIHAFFNRSLRNLFDLKVYVSADKQTRAQRWWERAHERNTKGEMGYVIFNRTMEMHDSTVEPAQKYADIVIDTGKTNITQVSETVKRFTQLLLKAMGSPKREHITQSAPVRVASNTMCSD